MKEYLKTYKVTLHTVGPVFIGSGREISKKEYLFLPGNQIGVMDIGKLCYFMKKRHLERQFEDFLLNDPRIDLKKWLRNNRIDDSQIDSCLKYKIDRGDTVLQRGTKTRVMEFMRDPYGKPYVPGSSLKGMFRTILLASDMLGHSRKFQNAKKEIVNYSLGKEKLDFKKVSRQLEQTSFYTLKRDEENRYSAVNDVMSGFLVSDSIPLESSDLVLCQKQEVHTNGMTKPLNLLRECIRPNVKIQFTITIDRSLCKMDSLQISNAISKFAECYNECFAEKFASADKINKDEVILGGGAGFVSKTVIYPLLGKEEGLSFAQHYFENSKISRNHYHHRYKQLGVSPHIYKCTKYANQILPTGVCRMVIE